MAEDEYETLPENASVVSHMLAGACAGIMEHTIIYPVDCVKVIFTVVYAYSGKLIIQKSMIKKQQKEKNIYWILFVN